MRRAVLRAADAGGFAQSPRGTILWKHDFLRPQHSCPSPTPFGVLSRLRAQFEWGAVCRDHDSSRGLRSSYRPVLMSTEAMLLTVLQSLGEILDP